MYNLLSKKGLLFAFLLGVVVILLFFIPVLTGLDGFNALSEDQQTSTSIFDTGLYLTIVLVVIAALAILVFSIMSIVGNPKGSLRGILAFVGLLVLFGIGYAMTSEPGAGSKLAATVTRFNVDLGSQKIINGALFLGIGMVILTAVAFILSELRNVLK